MRVLCVFWRSRWPSRLQCVAAPLSAPRPSQPLCGPGSAASSTSQASPFPAVVFPVCPSFVAEVGWPRHFDESDEAASSTFKPDHPSKISFASDRKNDDRTSTATATHPFLALRGIEHSVARQPVRVGDAQLQLGRTLRSAGPHPFMAYERCRTSCMS